MNSRLFEKDKWGMGRMWRLLGLALLGAALTLPLAGCWNTKEGGSRYELMYRSERERAPLPEFVGAQSHSATGGPTRGQGRAPEQGGAQPGMIR